MTETIKFLPDKTLILAGQCPRPDAYFLGVLLGLTALQFSARRKGD